MSLKLKFFLLLLLSISIPSSSAMVEPLRDIKITEKSIIKVGSIQMNARKLMTLDVQDYDETKANNRHDPKKPGNGKP
ncbi:protein PSY2-like [Benincasa hispida]|uniref:protein PSY2-like n=1 Tax=Benincasa hispida TaxID=102211 RepID=UPI0019022559|nr:protein PSY2-like [Benincasa hispida]